MDKTKSIIIIDDEYNLRRSLALLLQEAGYSVTTASNGEEALRCLQQEFYDLAFLDIRLPDKSGIELLPLIRDDFPDMPILLITGHATMDTAVEAIRHGARDYLLKPIQPAQLLKRVRELFEEQTQPNRRRELVDQIQNLLSELQEVEGISSTAAPETTSIGDQTRMIRCGQLMLNLLTHQATLSDKAIRLPPTTFDYLVTLVRHSPNPVPYETLVMEAQSYSVTRAEAREMAGWHIHELRKAMETKSSEPKYIITVRNVGYRFVP